MKMITRALACEVERADAVTKTFTFTASTDSIDRYGEIVKQDWDLRGFDANPVILWAHDPGEPIGRGVAKMIDGKLKVDITFHEVTERARDIAALVEAKFLNAVSVGFRPKTVKFETVNEREVPVLSGNELLEISVVSIPANPDALAERAFLRSLAGDTAAPVHQEKSKMLHEIRKALGLADTITEEAVLETAKSFAAAAGDIVEFCKATGTDSVNAALGVVSAWKSAAEKLPVVEAKVLELEGKTLDTERSSILKSLETEGRITPAQLEKFKAMPLDFVRAFAETAPKVPQLSQPRAEAPAGTSAKRWEDYGPDALASIHETDPALYEALKADRDARKTAR